LGKHRRSKRLEKRTLTKRRQPPFCTADGRKKVLGAFF
jgi:hypothetical protein